MEGRKDDKGKLRYDLLPPSVVEALVKVLTYGAAKYDDHNWEKVPDLDARYYAAGERHRAQDRMGIRIDPETGLPHLAHAMCCDAFRLSKLLGFDRPLTEPSLADDLDELDDNEPIPFTVSKITTGTYEITQPDLAALRRERKVPRYPDPHEP